MPHSHSTYIGLMSGTSLDGVDGVLVQFPKREGDSLTLLASAHVPFPHDLKQQAMDLQQAGENEIHREALFANAMVKIYANCVEQLRSQHSHNTICAIGVHGQTIRHRPELGYTRQANNPALLAEMTGIDVIADFRSRDIAAGGHGAPLVPAFHRAMFGQLGHCRVVVNIGGMSNISILHANGHTSGFDTGPGNVLMDAWIHQNLGHAYDANGAWAAQGKADLELLARLCNEPFLRLLPPKSTGRDLFHLPWLNAKLADFSHLPAVDVQASLCEFTAKTIADAMQLHAPSANAVYVCGGGAENSQLMQLLSSYCPQIDVQSTTCLGIAPQHVEAIAFAWLAQRFMLRLPGNLVDVTGAKGERVLGALYPASL